MKNILVFLRKRLNQPVGQNVGRWLPSFQRVSAIFSLLALVSLSYVLGAVAMHFSLPTSGYLTKAFLGAEDYLAETNEPVDTSEYASGQPILSVDRSDETFNGYTLVTMSNTPEAKLLNLNGEVVHHWRMRDRRPWPRAALIREPLPDEPIHWERVYLYPNGDLLALCVNGADSAYGYGLAKFDKDSKFLWGYSGNLHHDFDVGDDGRIYVLAQHDRASKVFAKVKVSTNVEFTPAPDPAEELIVLSPEGQELDTFPLYETIRDSHFNLLFLASLESRKDSRLTAPGNPPFVPWDTLHSNSVKVLHQALAPKFPLFHSGMLLISFRSPGLLAVFDPQRHSLIWAAKGVWEGQHDAQFLDNGHLLLYDNLGSLRGARVMEYDPISQAIAWSCSGDDLDQQLGPFNTPFRGGTQRLPNGNTLIVDPGERVLETTKSKEVVWQLSHATSPSRDGDTDAAAQKLDVLSARRFSPEELPFLKSDGPTHPPEIIRVQE